jgi:hypothetical protein
VLNDYCFISQGAGLPDLRHGIIVAKEPGKMRFQVRFEGVEWLYWFDRADFKLPPLPREQRQPEWVSDISDGFDYVGVEGF